MHSVIKILFELFQDHFALLVSIARLTVNPDIDVLLKCLNGVKECLA